MSAVSSKRRRGSLKRRLLEHLTTVEILAYRAALLISFLIYAYEHLKDQLHH